MNMRALFLCTTVGLAVAGCGSGTDVPSSPTLQLPFVTSQTNPVQFNDVQGVLVGTSGFLTFGASNIGSQAMTITTVTYSGPSAITLQPGTDKPLPATISYNDELLIGLTCTPTAQQTYAGTVEIKSNASNTPDATIYVSCTGK